MPELGIIGLKSVRSYFGIPWLEWGHCVPKHPSRWLEDTSRRAPMLSTTPLHELHRVWVARTLGQLRGAPRPHATSSTSAMCPLQTFYVCGNVENHKKEPEQLTRSAAGSMSTLPGPRHTVRAAKACCNIKPKKSTCTCTAEEGKIVNGLKIGEYSTRLLYLL